MEFIGTIHTHTYSYPEVYFPSPTDNVEAHAADEKVFAIDVLNNGKNGCYTHHISFFKPQVPLETVVFV